MAILGNTKATNLTLLDGFVGNLNPVETGVYDLGTSSLKWRTLYGNAESASAVKDNGNGTLTKFQYSASGMSSTSWLGSWDGYTLKAITPANAVKSGIGTTAIGSATKPVYWTGSAFAAISSYEGTAATADKLTGFSSRATNFTWGNQTGTAITVMNDSSGGSLGFRKDNPASGQMSMVIDGTVYIKEGAKNVGDAITSITRNGTTFTYTTLWGNTGTFDQQDSNTTSFTITANATDGIWDITGTNGTNAVTYAVGPYSSQQSKASFDTSTTNPTRSDRLNYNGYLYATKLYSGGSAVLTSVSKSDIGLGNVANLDQSKAIKSITRNGTTFTYTALDGTTGTFSQQDNNTWTAMTGATSSANGTVGYVNAVPPKDGYNTKYLRADGTWTIPPNTNTWRPIQVNGAAALSDSTTTLNLKAGSNVSISNSSGTVTITATDTTYSSLAAASGGTAVSLVTTGEKYTWNSKTSNTGTVTSITAGTGLTTTNGGSTDGGSITTSGTLYLTKSGATAGSYGPSANVNGSNGTTMNVPYITVDAYGRVTSISNKTYTSVNTEGTDTKNTAGSTDTSSKIFLVGAASQTASAQTYSDNQVYVTNGQLDANVVQVATHVKLQYNTTTNALDFVFV